MHSPLTPTASGSGSQEHGVIFSAGVDEKKQVDVVLAISAIKSIFYFNYFR